MMRTMKQLKRSMIAMFLVVCMICSNTLPAFADQAVASTMRLAKTEGTVSVTNKNGRDMGTKADMKLFNGYNLGTEQASYAWIGLDDSKIIKLDAVSEAEIQKKGKDLEVLLNSGNLFFNVTESLKADETLNIRTSTMVTGIRGTCGWVKVLDSWRTEVFILEGSVECWVMDPVTGQAKSVRLGAGQKATFVVYDQMREGDKCDIIMGTYGENEIDPFVAVELLNDPDLRDRVGSATGFNVGAIINGAEARLDAKEQEVAQKSQVIQNQLFNQPNTVKDPVFETNRSEDTDRTSGGNSSDEGNDSDSDNTTTTPPSDEPIEMTMPIDDVEELNTNLQTNDVIIHASDNAADNTLTIDSVVTVPENVTLTIEDGIDMNVEEELRINGTLDMSGDVYNYDVITNTSMNTFDVNGKLYNMSTGEIHNTGRIITADGLENNGYVGNAGVIVSDLALVSGTFEIQSGSVLYLDETNETNDTPIENLTLTDGVLSIADGSFDVTANAGTVSVQGGNIGELKLNDANAEISGGSVDIITANNSSINLNAGTIDTLNLDRGKVNVEGGVLSNVTLAEIVGPSGPDGAAEEELNVTGGEVTTATVYGGAVTLSGGCVGTLTQEDNTLNIENDAYIENLVVNATAVITGGEIQTAVFGDIAPDISGGVIDSATMNGITPNITGGTINELELIDGGLELSETNVALGDVVVRGTRTLDNADDLAFIMDAGTVSSITLDGVAGILSDGTVKNGIVLKGTDTQLTLEGGNIYAGLADAALLVDVEEGEVTEGFVDMYTGAHVYIWQDNIPYGNDVTQTERDQAAAEDADVIIDGEGKTAIQVNKGAVSVDITDKEYYSVTIKAENCDNFVNVAGAQDVASAYVPYEEYLFFQNESYMSYLIDGEDYILRNIARNFENILIKVEAGETVEMKQDEKLVSEDGMYYELEIPRVANDAEPIVLDLNGYTLEAYIELTNDGNLTETEAATTKYKLKICDSDSSGMLTGSLAVGDFNELTLENINYENPYAIRNYEGILNVIGGNYVGDDSSGGDYEPLFINYGGTINVEGGTFTGPAALFRNIMIDSMTPDSGTITLKDAECDGLAVYSEGNGSIVVEGGTYRSTYEMFSIYDGNLSITDGAELYIESDMEGAGCAIGVAGTDVVIGDSDSDTVMIYGELADSDGYGPFATVIDANIYPTDSMNIIRLENVTIDGGDGPVACLDYSYQVIIGDNVELTSASRWGTLVCERTRDSSDLGSPIVFESSVNSRVENTSDSGVGVVNQALYVGSVETELLVFGDSELNYLYENEDDAVAKVTSSQYDSTEDIVRYAPYGEDPLTWTPPVTMSLLSLRPASPSDAEEATDSDAIEGTLPEDSDGDLDGSGDDDVIDDSSDNDDDDDTSSDSIGTATDADATEDENSIDTATDADAADNGEPMTGSPAAIPLAAALLGIWMSMPKEYKRRNRKEC